jgi:hypothetical protein
MKHKFIIPNEEELVSLKHVIPEGYQVQGGYNLALIICYLIGGLKTYREEWQKLLYSTDTPPHDSEIECDIKAITIPKEEYLKLKKDSAFLSSLKEAGVDNWEGYDCAAEEFKVKYQQQ